MKISELGEFKLIDLLAGSLKQHSGVVLGPGDDAALVDLPDGDALITTDILIEGVHFRTDWASAVQIGRRAAAQNLADIAAMGGISTAAVVALGLPPTTEVDWVRALVAGIASEIQSVGAAIVGGDLSTSDRVVISITVLGMRNKRPAVTRAGAQIGEQVAVFGELGWSAAGLACIQRGYKQGEKYVERFLVPQPPYEQGPIAAKAGATAMIDVSDGLLADVGHIASASDVSIDLELARLLPSRELLTLAGELGTDALLWVLAGGEDHALVATFPERKKLPTGWKRIGVVSDTRRGEVTLDGKSPVYRSGGHQHFG